MEAPITEEQIDALLSVFLSQRPSREQLRDAKTAASKLKANALRAGDEPAANSLWIREQAIEAQYLYLQAFAELHDHKYYEAWCTLERTEVALHFLRPHAPTTLWQAFNLDFVDTYVRRFQSLYPYRIFSSPEIAELEKECTICGKKISPRKPCGHEVGRLYNGEMCARKVTKWELISIAMVDDPVQKYSVPFLSDPKTGKSVDHYKYHFLDYLVPRLESPFDNWDVHDTTKLHPHSRFTFVGRNDKCPCGSGSKYKKCCLSKPGVQLPHKEFILPKPPPPHLRQEVIVI